jgi:toxin ParE1/3/4
MSARYLIRPKADQDLEEQAFYLAQQARPELGHRFLVAAHETFTLLASNPAIGWHSQLDHPQLTNLRFFRISGFEKMLVLYLPVLSGIEILRVIHGSRNLMALMNREGLK